MKKWMIPLIFLLVFSVVISACGTEVKESSPSEIGAQAEEVEVNVDLASYVPTTPGTVLKYKIEVGEVYPLLSMKETFHLDGSYGPAIRKYINPDVGLGGTFDLELRIKGDAAGTQGCQRQPDGIEFEIINDSLGIYRGVRQLFWAINDNNFALEVIVFQDINTFLCSYKPIMTPTLTYIGEQPRLEDYIEIQEVNNDGQLHIRRTVLADELTLYTNTLSGGKVFNYNSTSFTEDYWFEPGRGLVKFIQTTETESGDKVVSMTWTRLD